MNRLHIVGGKNHGKTTLIVELVRELTSRGIVVGTIKHTHHHHELDVPGKDSFEHRQAGAAAVGILSPSMLGLFIPLGPAEAAGEGRYTVFSPMFQSCQVVLVEGDSQTRSPKIEVWRSALGTPPLAAQDPAILAVVTDDAPTTAVSILPRSDVARLSEWILQTLHPATPG